MNTKSFYAIVGTLMLIAFAFGYYLAPGKTKTKTVEVVKTVEVEREKHRETVTVQTQRPDGTKETVTKVVEDTKTAKNTEERKDTKATEAPVSRPKVSLAALAGSGLPLNPVYGAYVSKEIIGPITIGAWGLSSGVVGLSAGLNF